MAVNREVKRIRRSNNSSRADADLRLCRVESLEDDILGAANLHSPPSALLRFSLEAQYEYLIFFLLHTYLTLAKVGHVLASRPDTSETFVLSVTLQALHHMAR